jgi:hypothetical protein
MYTIIINYSYYEYKDISQFNNYNSDYIETLIKVIRQYIIKKDNSKREWDIVYSLYDACNFDISDSNFKNGVNIINIIEIPEFSISITKIKK